MATAALSPDEIAHPVRSILRRSLLTFVIVGGGPTGVECAGAISELVNLALKRDYIFYDRAIRLILHD